MLVNRNWNLCSQIILFYFLIKNVLQVFSCLKYSSLDSSTLLLTICLQCNRLLLENQGRVHIGPNQQFVQTSSIHLRVLHHGTWTDQRQESLQVKQLFLLLSCHKQSLRSFRVAIYIGTVQDLKVNVTNSLIG